MNVVFYVRKMISSFLSIFGGLCIGKYLTGFMCALLYLKRFQVSIIKEFTYHR